MTGGGSGLASKCIPSCGGAGRARVACLLLAFFVLLCFVAAQEQQVVTKTISPLECVQGNKTFLFWRELSVYEVVVHKDGVPTAKRYYSTVTLHLKNNGPDVDGLEVREGVPDSVASVPSELLNFSFAPLRLEEGSVVVTYLFEHVGAGEERQASYTVERKLDRGVLNDYAPPKIVSAAPAQEKRAGFDWTLPVLALLLLAVGGTAYYFTRRISD